MQRSGEIRVLDAESGVVQPDPLLDLDDVRTDTESGLLGLAFDPDHADNKRIYTFHSRSDGAIALTRYEVAQSPTGYAATDATTLLTIPHDPVYHYGGWIGFSPLDHELYVTTGAPLGPQARDLSGLYGKILRLDVNKDDFPDDPARNYGIPADNPYVQGGGLPEVWAYGFRNPWRASFDRTTGDLYLGDVGENRREEIDFLPAGLAGADFGWNQFEGTLDWAGGNPSANYAPPIYEYDHDEQHGYAVAGGIVYRGDQIGGDVSGSYFFGDFITGRIWSLRPNGSEPVPAVDRTEELAPSDGKSIDHVAGWGEDALGRLYIVDWDGDIFRIDAVPAKADADQNGVVDLDDFGLLQANFGRQGARWDQGDFDGDQVVGLADFGILKTNFGLDSSSAPVVPVPEPASRLLALLAASCLSVGRLRPSLLRALRPVEV